MKNKTLFLHFLSIILVVSGCKLFMVEEPKPATLEYVGAIDISPFYNSTDTLQYDITFEGTLFSRVGQGALNQRLPVGTLTQANPVRSQLKTPQDTNLTANFIRVDKHNLVHIFINVWGKTTDYIYKADGTLHSRIKASVSLPAWPVMDYTGTNDLVITSRGTLDSSIKKVKGDLSSVILEKSHTEIRAMLPFLETDESIVIFDLRIDARDRVYVIVETHNGTDGSRDGILILDSDLNYLHYIGEDWLFNFPQGVDLDNEGYIYATGYYNNTVKVFDKDYKLVACSMDDDVAEGSSGGQMNKPEALSIRNNKVYVLDSKNRRITIYKTLSTKPDPAAAAIPDIFNKTNTAPVISEMSAKKYYNYDADNNYMGGTISLSPTVTDAENDTVTYQWTITNTGVGTATLSSRNTKTTVITMDSFSTGKVVLTVTDEMGGHATYSYTFGPPTTYQGG